MVLVLSLGTFPTIIHVCYEGLPIQKGWIFEQIAALEGFFPARVHEMMQICEGDVFDLKQYVNHQT